MEVVTAPDDAAWDRFCDRSPDAWFWHTSAWRSYTLAYRPELRSRSRHFFVRDGAETLLAVPLMVEELVGGVELSFGGGNCWAPMAAPGLGGERRSEAFRVALRHVDAIAKGEGATRASLRVTPLAAEPDAVMTFVAEAIRAGYADIGTASMVLDLRSELDGILRAMTKGHRSDIARACRSLTVEVADGKTDATAAFEDYRQLHHKAAGRTTRPAETFDLMRGWIDDAHGLVVVARDGSRAVSAAYVNLYKHGAYYSSAANDPATRLPAGHLVQWTAIAWLKEHGYHSYELGLQQFGPLPHDVPSTKEMNISRFKRGFGGALVPVPVREKWYDSDAFSRTAAERAAAFAAALSGPRDVPPS